MTVEQNLRMVDAAFEAINERNWDHLWGLHVDNIVMSSPDLPEPVKGREAVQERLQAWGEALPDLSWTRVRGFGQGDWVCVELLITGTHKGPLRHGFDRRFLPADSDGGVPPPRDPIGVWGGGVEQGGGGRVSESHIYYDQLEFLK